jgi:DnaJ like chaperone protein
MAAKNFFDTLRDSLNQIVSGNEKTEPSAGEKQRQQSAKEEIESAIIVLATEIMRLNGNESAETKKILIDFLNRNFGKGPAAKRNKQIEDHLFVGSQPFTKMACEQLKSLATRDSRQEVIRLLYEIASYDDFVSTKENSGINKVAKYLEISVDEMRALREKFGRIHDPYAVLEIEQTTSVTAVKAAYRKVVLKYHPDKRDSGISEEEASRKFREVKKAYEMILKKLHK